MNAFKNASLGILILVLLADFAHTAESSRQPAVQVEVEKAPASSEPDMTVSPTYELAGLIDRYEKGLRLTDEQEARIIQRRTEWLNRKKNGYTRWGSQKWMLG